MGFITIDSYALVLQLFYIDIFFERNRIQVSNENSSLNKLLFFVV